MQELSRIQHGEYALEEKVKSCRCAMEEKVAEMKNSLNTFKVGAQLAGGCTPATSARVACFPCLHQPFLLSKKTNRQLFQMYLLQFLWLCIFPPEPQPKCKTCPGVFSLLEGPPHKCCLLLWERETPAPGCTHSRHTACSQAVAVPYLSPGQVSCISCRNQSCWGAGN